jgi:hypothetical protein
VRWRLLGGCSGSGIVCVHSRSMTARANGGK